MEEIIEKNSEPSSVDCLLEFGMPVAPFFNPERDCSNLPYWLCSAGLFIGYLHFFQDEYPLPAIDVEKLEGLKEGILDTFQKISTRPLT